MKKIVVHSGFHPEVAREYKGEYIHRVIATRMLEQGTDGVPEEEAQFLQLENNAWIHRIGPERYITDWTDLERWGRVEEIEYDERGNRVYSRNLGYIVLAVDRENGLL